MANLEKKNMNKDDLREKLSNINGFIGAADNKTAIGLGIFSFAGLFISFIFADNLNLLIAMKEKSCFIFWIVIILFVISLITFLVSLILFVSGIFPRFITSSFVRKIKKENTDDEEKNFWFFKHIASFESFFALLTAYTEKFGVADEECKQILQEIYSNSIICLRKMNLFRVGIIFSTTSVFSSIVASVLLVISSLA